MKHDDGRNWWIYASTAAPTYSYCHIALHNNTDFTCVFQQASFTDRSIPNNWNVIDSAGIRDKTVQNMDMLSILK